MSYAGASNAAICIDGTTGAASGCTALKGTVTTCKTLLGRYTISAGKYEYRYCKGTDATV